jgi:aspartate aminotransferase-like enzyme
LPPEVRKALAMPALYHRTAEFAELFARLNRGLQYVFQTRNPVYTLACSGTGAMQAAVCGLMPKGGRALVLSTGLFGDRWAEMLRRIGVPFELLRAKNGDCTDLNRLEEILKTKGTELDAVFFTHVETSTGALNPAAQITSLVRQNSNALLVMDGVSSLGIEDARCDAWGVDCAVCASQKGLMNSPGLGFISMSQRARLQAQRAAPPFYFDLGIIGRMHDKGQPAFTLSSGLLRAQAAALEIIEAATLPEILSRTKKMAATARKLAAEADLALFAREPATGLTVMQAPQRIVSSDIIKQLHEKFEIIIADGQLELKGRLLRVAHMGHMKEPEVKLAFAAIKEILGTNR